MPSFKVTCYKNKQPIGKEEIVEAPSAVQAISEYARLHPELLDKADDFDVVRIVDNPTGT